MRTTLLLIAIAALALPVAATAKGPASASISGPGGGVTLSGGGEGGSGTPLGALVEAGGFFPGVFGQSPDPMLAERPAGELGPKYTVTYAVPGPNGTTSRIVQHLYPYAKPHPLTYMPPGQEFWSGERTHGGWYVASGNLTTDIGLPATPPDGGTSVWPWVALGVGLAAAAVAAALLVRRLPRTRAATA